MTEADNSPATGDALQDVHKNLYHLCDRIGPRFAGTDGFRRAADFMVTRFEQYGLDRAQLEPFEISAWRRGAPARLVMTEPWDEAIDCYALPYAASTGPQGTHAEIVDLSHGLPEHIEANKDKLAGRFALVVKPGRHRMGIYEDCVAAGAVGFLLGSHTPGMGLATGCVTDGFPGALPAVAVGFEAALKLQRLAATGPVRLRLLAQHHCEPDTTWNIVGELTGTEHPDDLIVIGGHLDSHEIGPGAYDNCAGAVMVMEVARLLAEQRDQLKRTVRFIGFAAEEIGLLGSKHHATAHADELKSRALVMCNCDMPALCPPWTVGYHTCPQGEAVVSHIAQQTGLKVEAREIPHNKSDFYPFTQQGVPAIALTGSRPKPGPRFGHMAADTPDKIPTDMLADAASVVARILLQLAADPGPLAGPQ